MSNEDALKEAKQRYKATVHLPQTDFPMKAGLQEREPALQKKWAEEDLYGKIRAARKGAKPWVLHDGPPYANGDAHTGTGMNKSLKDMVVKFRTMQGFDSPYVPGWDCHGLPIEHKVLQEMGGKLPEGTTALQMRERCLEYATKYIDIQRKQFQATGTLGRWDEPYLTTNPSYEANVLQVFRDLFTKGYITRAQRSVHWSWAAQSALAEAELEYEDRQDTSIYLRMMAQGQVAGVDDVALLIWTTTPWTMPANLAIAAAKDAEYAIVEYTRNGNTERMVVAEELREAVVDKSGLADVKVLKHLRGAELEGVDYAHPLWGTTCPVVFADYVTLEDGTGLVHTAPGHGKEDFETGKNHNWFNVDRPVCPVSENGTYYTGERLREELNLPKDYQDDSGWLAFIDGKHIMKANDAIVERLREQGLLLHSEKFTHSYPHCWRTHTPVIFRATEQWFVNVDHVEAGQTKPLRQRILDEIKLCKWYPSWGEKRISAMLENRPDWCISRQRYWGIPIPAFMDEGSGKVCMSQATVDRVISLVAEHGSNVWYDDANWPVEKLLPDEVRPDEFKGRKLKKMEDIFDVWFESGSSFQAVMRTDADLKDKALVEGNRTTHSGMYLEGDDQHRGWFQVSLILSVATTGVAPFRDCLTCAFVVDEKGEKGSKSKGNMWPIDQGCRDLGADLVRLYFASIDTSSPVPVTYDLIRGAGDSYRKLRNTWRTLVANLFDFDPAQDAVAADKLSQLDRWALSRTAQLVEDVTACFERYEFHHAMRALVQFCTVELSSQYIDVCKDDLYCEAATAPRRRAIQTVYWQVANVIAKFMAPVTVHTAEEMWQYMPKPETESVHLALWPKVEGLLVRKPELDKRFKLMFRMKAESDRVLDRLRKEKVIGKGYDANVTLGLGTDLMKELANYGTPEQLQAELPGLLNVSKVALDAASDHAALQEFEPATDVQGLWVKVEASAEQACVRCFRRTGDVGSVKEHEFLCTRCAGVVG
ncbi:MAG: isoleucine--tRNA ligase [Planctomycetes bacterium]|nr:isoleucine--tRNA ligase [Planctomycetota bacterium]